MRVLVLSDTHAPNRWRRIPGGMIHELRGADLILHAGDVSTPEVLDELAEYAPVRVVMGNVDGPGVRQWGATRWLDVELEGVRIGMMHDVGDLSVAGRRMANFFDSPDLVIHGHTHVPGDVVRDGVRMLNPGSPTDKRGQLYGTFAVLDLADGQIDGIRIVPLVERQARK